MGTSIKTLNMPLLTNGIEVYIARVKQIPVLTAQEEQALAESFYYHHDLAAARKLIVANLRFVVHIAHTYMGYGLALADLIQEGNIGLMKAVKRFNPKVGVRVISFAVHWIKAEIQEFILRNWRIVKVATTKAQRRLFFNLRKVKQSLSWLNHTEVEAVANDLGVKPKTVREMEARLTAQDMRLDSGSEEEYKYSHSANTLPVVSFADFHSDPACLLETSDLSEHNQANMRAALAELDPRSREIITQRWLSEPKTTLQALANLYHVSLQRIQQLEQNAIKKLRGLIEAAA